ncbi:hypothetical protein BUALT_Bualt01G0078300 [Buddleja alternifolia]|uniref:J domain-containing protein n=1 Tax=Buddleja alternifolia TaxID=168488 RepID=A0AAV6Y6A6_9LAMI|nr:hypothetical protein BUALT_Bualt01G0078300 [Buddleja alternifolia]
MECNKDEALRSKSIAEGKLDKRDFAGARKLALKAQNLFPGLDGISQMSTTIDVYISAENKISGEVDWYGLLGLNPSVDDEAIKKQYRKLALMLHPDKNKSVGANGAFVLISEAFGMLSDKPKRLAYNQRRGFRVFQQKVPVPTSGSPSAPPPSTGNGSQSKTPKSQNKSTKPPPPPKPAPTPKPTPSFQRTDTRVSSSSSKTTSKASKSQNKSTKPPLPPKPAPTPKPTPSFQRTDTGVSNSASKTTSKAPRSQNKSTKLPLAPKPAPTPKPTPSFQRTDTFWTICHRCKRQYQYLKMYLNHTILCNNCKVPFMALATPTPQNIPKSSNQVPKQRQQSSSNHVQSQTQGRTMPAAEKPEAGQAASNSVRNASFQQGLLPGKTDQSQTQGTTIPAAEKPEAGQAAPNSVRNASFQQGLLPGKTDASVGEKIVHTVHQAHDNLKRTYNTKSCPKEESVKERRLDDYSSRLGVNYNMGPGNGGFGNANANAYKMRKGILLSGRAQREAYDSAVKTWEFSLLRRTRGGYKLKEMSIFLQPILFTYLCGMDMYTVTPNMQPILFTFLCGMDMYTVTPFLLKFI